MTAAGEKDLAWVAEHVGLVRMVARGRFTPDPAMEYEDVVSAGMVGLMIAARSYDPSRGAFSGFAVPRIRGEIGELFRRHKSLEANAFRTQKIRVGAPGSRKTTYGDDSPVEISDILTEDIVDAGTLALDSLLDEERRRALRATVEQLPEQERTVIVGVFFSERKAKDIAASLGVTEGRVSQIRKQALKRLAITLSEFAYAA